MPSKMQFMALVEPTTLFRLDRLRIITEQSRARVAEQVMVDGGLHKLEQGEDVEAGISRLNAIAEKLKVTPEVLVKWYAKAYARQYGPGLDGIEAAYRAARHASEQKAKAAKAARGPA